MTKKIKNISLSSITELLKQKGIRQGSSLVRNYTRGMNPVLNMVPQDVVAWITTHDLVPEGWKYHARFVLKIPLNLPGITLLDGRAFSLNPGNAMLIFPYQVHSNKVAGKQKGIPEFLIITFALPGLAGPQILNGLKNRIIPLTESWAERLVQVIAGYQGKGKHSESNAVFTLAGVLAEMTEQYPYEEHQTDPPDRLTEICEYMKENKSSRLNIKTLADHFSLSPSTILRMFRNGFGPEITPGRFLESIRLQQASIILLNSKHSIARIAEACGYRDQFSFSRAFKRMTGLSPRAYRLRNKQ